MKITQSFDELYFSNQLDLLYEKTRDYATVKMNSRGYTFNSMEVQDVAQEIVINLYKNLSSYDVNKGKVSTFIMCTVDKKISQWLHTSTYKKYYMLGRGSDQYLEYGEDAGEDFVGCNAGDYDLELYEFEFNHDLESAKLSKKEYEVLKFKMSGYSTDEIAEKYGCSKCNVSKIWGKAKEKLKNIF